MLIGYSEKIEGQLALYLDSFEKNLRTIIGSLQRRNQPKQRNKMHSKSSNARPPSLL